MRARLARVRGRRGGLRALALGLCLAGPSGAGPALGWGPCAGDCAVAVYGGSYVEDAMERVLVRDPTPPWAWDYRDDTLVGFALSRRVAQPGRHWSIEAEAGLARRSGLQDEYEVWGAAFLRYDGFPWNDTLRTTFAVSTGLNYATAISEVERERARDGEGNRLMHYFSPEVTFALPARPDRELLFRFHHRSGVFGLVSDAWGGAQYGTVGVRIRF